MTLNLNLSTDPGSQNPSQLSPLTLAFIGDSVYDLMVRETLVREANRSVGKLHGLAAKRVCAGAQAEAARGLLDGGLLTEDEFAVFKRGRNAHTFHTPKNATNADYHLATGVEAMVGYLYLKGDLERLREIFELMQEESLKN
ncbi:MAG: ribonuclease III [Oscillospiraceae bacterium]|nr:ribonuclease III [Oscillospiraceae bacterium]